MRSKIAASTILLLLFAGSIYSQPNPLPKGQQPGVSAEKWLEDLRAANRGKWNEKWVMTGQIRYLSERALDYLSDRIKQEKDSCKLAAAHVGHAGAFQNFAKGGFHDMGKAAILTGKEIAEALSPATTLRKLIKDAAKKGAEWLAKYMQELLAKEKAEVHITHANRDGCKLVVVSIWDKAASQYEVIIYGDCQCAPLNTNTDRGKVKVNTFEIRLGGKANIGLDETNENLILKADVPSAAKITCDVCKAEALIGTAPKPPVETPPGPGLTEPLPPPPVSADPCKVPPPCPQCKTNYDKIVSACKEIDGINKQLAEIKVQLTPREEREKKATGKELQDLKETIAGLKSRAAKFAEEKAGLQAEIKADVAGMKECERTRCGKTATGNPAAGTLDACLVGSWVSQTSTDIGGAVGKSGIKMTIAADATATIIYTGMEPAKLINPVSGQTDMVKTWSGTASGKIIGKNGVLILKSVESSALELIVTQYGRTDRKPTPKLGIVIPETPHLVKYQCDERSLTISVNFFGDIVDGFIFGKR